MPFVTDASSLINLNNAQALDVASRANDEPLLVTQTVLGECNVDCVAEVMRLEKAGQISLVLDDDIPTDRFLELLAQFGLGDGETECIAAAEKLGFPICCDDKRARNLGRELLGEENVIGSLALLRETVRRQLIECVTAFGYLQAMHAAGGYLPTMDRDYFCEGVDRC